MERKSNSILLRWRARERVTLSPLGGLFLIFIILWGGCAAAVERVSGSAPERVAETTAVSAGRVQITLRSIKGQPAAQLRPEANFRHATSNLSAAAKWVRLADGHEPDAQGRYSLADNETVTFEASGSFSQAGVWETALDVLGSDGSVAKRFVLAVTRTVPAFPRDFLVEPRPSNIDLGLFSPLAGEVRHITLGGRNATNDSIEVSKVGIVRFAMLAGQAELAAASSGQPAAESDCVGMLAPQQDCAITLKVPKEIGPGRYVVDIAAAGPGGQSLRSQQIDLRASAWWAGLLVVVGATLGALIDRWRTGGRATVGVRIAIAEYDRKCQMLAGLTQLPAARRALLHLQWQLMELDRGVRGGGTAPELKPFDERLRAITAAVQAYAAAEHVSGPPGALLVRLRQDLVTLLEQASADAAESATSQAMAKAAAALLDAVREMGALIRMAKAADEVLARLDTPLLHLLNDKGLDQARSLLSEQRRQVFALLANGGTSTVAERTMALDQNIQGLNNIATPLLAAFPERMMRPAESGSASAAGEKKNAFAAAFEAAKDLKRRWDSLSPEQRQMEARSYAVTYGAVLGVGGEEEGAVPTLEVPALLSAQTVLTLDTSSLLVGPSHPVSMETLQQYRTRWDFLTNAAVALSIGAVGVLALWNGNTTWGATTDLLLALLAGMGTRVAIGTVTPGT